MQLVSDAATTSVEVVHGSPASTGVVQQSSNSINAAAQSDAAATANHLTDAIASLGQWFHPWDFIESAAVLNPLWRSESRYPLHPEVLWERWHDPNELIGVRFGHRTRYLMLDIDRGSLYHPFNNDLEINEILGALEAIGLVRYLPVISSRSQGLHLYFPLAKAVPTYKLACLVEQVLKQNDVAIAPGTLELFPNPKAWSNEGEGYSLFNAHRLPLQRGSYRCDIDGRPIHDCIWQFLQELETTATQQDTETLLAAIDSYKPKIRAYQPSSKRAKAWQSDLKGILREGWTGGAQTNRILGKVAEYGRVFLGYDYEQLWAWMVEQCRNQLDGFREYSRHVSEIVKRCQDWAKSACRHRYPYQPGVRRPVAKTRPNNQEKAIAARARIKTAVYQLHHEGSLPLSISDRAKAIIKQAHCSLGTLYQSLDLWHPQHCELESIPVFPAPLHKHKKVLKPLMCKGLRTQLYEARARIRQQFSSEKSPQPPETGGSRGDLNKPPRPDPFSEPVAAPNLPPQDPLASGWVAELRRELWKYNN